MSNFNLTQFAKHSPTHDTLQVPALPYIAQENTAFVASTQSVVLDDETNLVRLILDGDGFMEYGTNPTATTSKVRLIANREYWFEVALGSSKRFALIDA